MQTLVEKTTISRLLKGNAYQLYKTRTEPYLQIPQYGSQTRY